MQQTEKESRLQANNLGKKYDEKDLLSHVPGREVSLRGMQEPEGKRSILSETIKKCIQVLQGLCCNT